MAQQVLYTPVPPKGSAYLRFVDALDVPLRVAPDFGPAQDLGVDPASRVGPYAVVERVAGRVLTARLVAAGRGGAVRLTALPGQFITVVIRPDGTGIAAAPIVDQADFNQTRAQLAFYNATPSCAGGALTVGRVAVFTGVAPGAVQARTVNPITATVLAACAGAPPLPVPLHGLEAGGSYSIWLMAPGATVAFLSRNATLPYAP